MTTTRDRPRTVNDKINDAPPRFVDHRCGHCGMTRKALNGAFLRWAREQAGQSLRATARRAGLSAAFLSDIENNRRHATPRAEAAYNEYWSAYRLRR